MKYINVLIILLFVIITNNSCIIAQSEEMRAINLLQKFYFDYNKLWSETELEMLSNKLDSIRSEYCSKRFLFELRKGNEVHGLDHDKVINDTYSDDIERLKILVTKDKKNPGTYIVSYNAIVTGSIGEVIEETVTISVQLIIENGILKIDNVY